MIRLIKESVSYGASHIYDLICKYNGKLLNINGDPEDPRPTIEVDKGLDAVYIQNPDTMEAIQISHHVINIPGNGDLEIVVLVDENLEYHVYKGFSNKTTKDIEKCLEYLNQ